MLARKISIFVLATTAVLFLRLNLTSAQYLNKQRLSATNNGFARTSFDSNVETLPPNYRGHDSNEIIAAINRRTSQAVKDEFETTEQFHKRIKALEASPLFGELKVDSLLAFVIISVETHYDAQLKTSIFRDKTLIDAHLLLGRIFVERGDRAQALAYAQSALLIDPNNREALKLKDVVTARK
jgi:tetratricopeptide (TPR) repeat protein